MIISTSTRYPGYVPWILLKHYDVSFRGRGVTVQGPDGMRVASEEGYMILNNGRRVEGLVKILPRAPF